MHTLWLKMLILYVLWLLLIMGGASAATWVIEDNKAMQQWYVLRDADAYYALMCVVLALIVGVQIAMTAWFLSRQV